jgi:lipoprotein-anchoring transpeptidase ErfK/SrfK
VRRIGLALLCGLGLASAGALSAAVAAGGVPFTGTTGSSSTVTTTSTTTTTTPDERIPAGVTIDGLSVGTLTRDEAKAAVVRAYGRPLVLVLARKRFAVTPAQAGASANVVQAVGRALRASPGTDVQLPVTINRAGVRAYVAFVARHFDRKPVDAKLYLRDLRPWITAEKPGRRLDRRPAALGIAAAFSALGRGPLRLTYKGVRASLTKRRFGPVIVIRRGSNQLYLYNGMRAWRVFPVATGQSVYPTPLGRFKIVVKWRNPWWYPPSTPWAKGKKPIPPGPGNPLGTRWMGLSAPGVGIHGTPDDASIGYSVSHGCIRMHIHDAEWLFVHVYIGTPVFIVAA